MKVIFFRPSSRSFIANVQKIFDILQKGLLLLSAPTFSKSVTGQARRGLASYSLTPRLFSLKIGPAKFQCCIKKMLDLVFCLTSSINHQIMGICLDFHWFFHHLQNIVFVEYPFLCILRVHWQVLDINLIIWPKSALLLLKIFQMQT